MTDAATSPAQEYLRSISDHVFKIYERVAENPTIAGKCLSELFRCQSIID